MAHKANFLILGNNFGTRRFWGDSYKGRSEKRFWFVVSEQMLILSDEWAETQAYRDQNLSGVIADYMEEYPPKFRTKAHEAVWWRIRDYHRALFQWQIGEEDRPTFNVNFQFTQ